MKILIVLGIIFCSGMIGYGLASTYRKKRVFYDELILVINQIKNNISFSNKSTKDIINNMKLKTEMKEVCNSYVEFIESKKEYSHSVNSISFLEYEEKNNIINMFDGFGRYNSETQITDLDNYKAIFDRNLNLAIQKENKNFPLCIKLGIIFGTLLSLLII